jgi:hypothetical protein
MAVYTTIDNPELYFQTKLYTGNSSTQSITFDGDEDMQPDFVWSKPRVSGGHFLSDSIRGGTKVLQAAEINAEITRGSHIQSFDTDGYTLAGDGTTNNSGDATVSWNWKAGTSFTNDASATGIGTIDSAGSVNTDAGFSIVSYTGTGSNATVGHGLGSKPAMMIFKERNGTTGWVVYHHKNTSAPATEYLQLNSTNATDDYAGYFNDTEPTSSVFTLGNDTGINQSGDTYIAYCFAEKQGYSKFGSYTGNGNVDGTFVYLGFKPAFVMAKATNEAQDWSILDNKRPAENPADQWIAPNTNAAEVASDGTALSADLLSNGFKMRGSAADGTNGSGDTFIYMAFAEAPFVNSNGVPCNAR